MTALAWTLCALGVLLGVGLGMLVARRRARRESISRTLVPARTRQLLSAMQSGAVVVRRDRRSAYCNNTALALGVARPDGALHPEVARLAERAWDRLEVVEEEIQVSRSVLGIPRSVHVRVTPLDDELAFAVANDNTENRAAEQMRRDFAANVSHELKTPVGALQLLAESIEQAADNPVVVHNFAKKMRKETRRLSKLIHEIIEITRLQGAEAVMDTEQVPLTAVVDEAIEGGRTAAELADISLITDIDDGLVVLGDRDLLVMAMRNLVDNAIHYSESGKHVTISGRREDDTAVLSVIDQGIGIAPKDVDRIFERFYRVDPARSRDSGGTGLGLSIVKHIAVRHDGAVDVWSQPGVGSTFTLRLPALADAEEEA